MKHTSFVLLAMVGLMTMASCAQAEISVIPQPVSVIEQSGTFELTLKTTIVVDNKTEELGYQLMNMLAPATVKHHATIGASYRPNKNMEWSFNYMHAFEETISGPTAYTNRPPGENNARISMYINSFGVSFAYMM